MDWCLSLSWFEKRGDDDSCVVCWRYNDRGKCTDLDWCLVYVDLRTEAIRMVVCSVVVVCSVLSVDCLVKLDWLGLRSQSVMV